MLQRRVEVQPQVLVAPRVKAQAQRRARAPLRLMLQRRVEVQPQVLVAPRVKAQVQRRARASLRLMLQRRVEVRRSRNSRRIPRFRNPILRHFH
jgi:hypothetical protein